MSRKYKFHNQDKLYFVTYTIINWLDIFTRNEYRQIILDSLKYCCQNKGLEVYGWCIMTNHVHLIVGTHGNNLEHILRDHKKHTSLALVEAIKTNLSESRREWIMEQFKNAADLNGHNTRHQVWQQHNQPIELSSEKMMFQYLDYLHNNPVKAGFVLCPEHWLYSSALDYFGKTGLLDCLIPIDVAIRG